MKIEKQLGKVSFTEMILYFLAGLLLLNGISYFIFILIFNKPFDELFSKVWIILIFVPLTQSIIQPLMNRDVRLKIESKDKSPIVWAKIVELLKQKEYQEIERTNRSLVFDFQKRWKRVFNMNQGKVKLSMNEGYIDISGKRNILYLIEAKVKYNNDINMS
ncbi:MAG TPA: hypothetical protein VFC67_09920 [Prolixibacteraceae bacterium]|nr:hypothetical protein [Prolixibacteraceae bacterium]